MMVMVVVVMLMMTLVVLFGSSVKLLTRGFSFYSSTVSCVLLDYLQKEIGKQEKVNQEKNH